MAGVEGAVGHDGAPRLKAAGVFMAGLAAHASAEPNSLVLRCELDDRELLINDAPETYYITYYYAKYPLVLVRLAAVTDEALRDLLSVSHRMALAKARR